MSGLHAARVAAKIRRELGVEVEMIHGHYGEYKVLVDDDTVVDGGARVILGVVPREKNVLDAVRARLK